MHRREIGKPRRSYEWASDAHTKDGSALTKVVIVSTLHNILQKKELIYYKCQNLLCKMRPSQGCFFFFVFKKAGTLL